MQKKTLILELSRNNLQGSGYFYASLELPAKTYELQDALQRLRLRAEGDDIFEVSVASCPLLPSLEDRRLDSPRLSELNFFAQRLVELNGEEQAVLKAVAPRFINEEEEPLGMKDLINLTYGLDKVSIVSNVGNDKQFGRYVIEHGLHRDIAAIPDESRYLLDERRIGELQRKNEGGVFVGSRYIIAGEYALPNIYDGEHLPEAPAADDYVFRLEIAKAPEEDIAEVEETGKWIELPMDKSNATAVAKAYGEERIEDCVYLYFESSIEQIDAQHFQDMANFDTLNALAARLKELSFADQIKFKAILEAEQPYKIGDVLDIAENLQDYELNASVASQEAFFKDYLIRHLEMRLDPSWLKSLDSGNKGRELLARLGATLTDYGIISARGRSLYEPVSLREPYTLMAEKFELIEVLGQPALFTNDRLSPKELPEGVYKYELREDDDGIIAGVEAHVPVNHGGTVLTKTPLGLGENGYQGFDDDSSPNFLGERMTIREFLDKDFEQQEEKHGIGGLER